MAESFLGIEIDNSSRFSIHETILEQLSDIGCKRIIMDEDDNEIGYGITVSMMFSNEYKSHGYVGYRPFEIDWQSIIAELGLRFEQSLFNDKLSKSYREYDG